MSEVVPAPPTPAETDNLLNMGEGDSPSAPPLAAPPEEQPPLYTTPPEQAPAPPPPPGVHEQAFVHTAPPPTYENVVPPPPADATPLPQGIDPPPTVGTTTTTTVTEEDSNIKTENATADNGDAAVEPEGDDEPADKKLKKLDGTAVVKKKVGRKPGSLNKKKNSYLMDRAGPMPSWNDMFFALMAFKAKLGTFNVPAQTKLGKWVTKNRQEYSKLQRKKIDYNHCSELSEERIQVLDSLGFIWDTMLHENGRRWNQRFEELKQWKEEHGHCNVPQSTSLGQWVKIQRENKREADLKAAGKLPQRTKPKPCLAPDRIEKWRVAAPVTGWDNRYNQLLEYAKTHNGDVNVPQYYPADKAFGRWVMKQRSEYSLRLRGLKSQLTDDRVEKLNAIGFSWVAPNFKRKVGVGIAAGSPASTVAAAAAAPVAKLPPLEKTLLEADGAHAPPAVPQPVPAAAAAATAPSPLPPPHDPTDPNAAPPPLATPQMVHHPAPPVPMEAPGEFPPLQHHDPHQPQHHHPHHLPPHHAAPPGTEPAQVIHHHHPEHPEQPPPPPPPQHEAIGEEGISMEFL